MPTSPPAAPQPIELSTQSESTDRETWLAYVETMTCGPHTIPRGAKIEIISAKNSASTCSPERPDNSDK